MSKILVIAEHADGKLNAGVAKAVACAQKIGGEIDVAVFAADGAAVAAQAAQLAGVTKVLQADAPANEHALAATLAPQVAELAGKGYTHVLAPGTTFGKDLAPRVAAKLGVPQVSDIMAVHAPNQFDRPTYAGNAITTVETPAGTVVGTVRLASFTAVAAGGGAPSERGSSTGMRPPFLHYGCHECAPPSWRNFDASPTLVLQRLPLVGAYFARGEGVPKFPPNVEYGDIARGLPVAENSCKAAYASHVLEHLALDDFRAALRNTLRYLELGGVFRPVVPDLRLLCDAYLRSPAADASSQFMRESYLGQEHRPRGFGGVLRNWLGNSAHRWMWDEKSMSEELRAAGFRDIRVAQFGDAALPEFRDVENAERWTGNLGMECRK